MKNDDLTTEEELMRMRDQIRGPNWPDWYLSMIPPVKATEQCEPREIFQRTVKEAQLRNQVAYLQTENDQLRQLCESLKIKIALAQSVLSKKDR